MKRQFSIIISLFLFGLLSSTAQTAGTGKVRAVDYSCPGKITVTYDLTTSQSTNVELHYSPNKTDWVLAKTVTGENKAQSSGTGKTIVWDCFADNVHYGGFYFKVEVPIQPELDCVWIDSVCWATRNVDAPGTFVENPEDPGMFYQWNRSTSWPATGNVTGWDNSIPTGTTWETANNVCPAGYRVPTADEIRSLINFGSRWTTQNGVSGREFGSGDNTIFLPAVGYHRNSDGTLYNVGSPQGYYWSSTQDYVDGAAYYLHFSSLRVYPGNDLKSVGFLCRCVAE